MSYDSPSISDYYREATQRIESYLLQGIADESRIVLDRERLAAELMNQYAFAPIEIASGPQRKAFKMREEMDDGYGRTGIGTVFYIRITLQVKPNKNIQEILRRIGSTYTYGPTDIRYVEGCLVTDMRAGNWDEEETEKAVTATVNNIQKEINWRNDAINQENAKLEARVNQVLDQRGAQIKEEAEQLKRLGGK